MWKNCYIQQKIKIKSIIKIVMLARSKLNSTESKISEALINTELVIKILWQILVKKETIKN